MPLSLEPARKLQLRRAVIRATDTDIAPLWTNSVLPTLSNAEPFLLRLSRRLGVACLTRKHCWRSWCSV
jgi:hypothetical protein